MSLQVTGNSLSAVQYAVRVETDYRTGWKADKADEVTQHALSKLNSLDGYGYTLPTGITEAQWRRHVEKGVRRHVRMKMGFITSLFLSFLISTVVRLIIAWWFTRPNFVVEQQIR